MNVIFHTAVAASSGALFSSCYDKLSQDTEKKIGNLMLAGATNVLLHGALDVLPHTYPLKSKADILISLLIIVCIVIAVQPKYILILLSCFLGGVLPDVIDLGPAMLNKTLNSNLPVVHFFPWHWPQYSGSIYVGGSLISLIDHAIVVFLCLVIVYIKRDFIQHTLFRKSRKT